MMTIVSKVIFSVVLASAAVLLHQTTPVDASCICPEWYLAPFYYADIGAVVLRAKVLSRRVEEDGDGGLTSYYKICATTYYAGGSDVKYSKRLYFTSSVSSSSTNDCRVNLRIGGDYLLSLFHRTSSGGSSSASDTGYSDQGGALTVGACDLNKPWTSVLDSEKEQLAHLLEGNDDDHDDDDDNDDDGNYKG